MRESASGQKSQRPTRSSRRRAAECELRMRPFGSQERSDAFSFDWSGMVEDGAMIWRCRPLSGIVAAAALTAISLVNSAGAAQPLRIAVIGGNGMIGQRIVREALDRG